MTADRPAAMTRATANWLASVKYPAGRPLTRSV